MNFCSELTVDDSTLLEMYLPVILVLAWLFFITNEFLEYSTSSPNESRMTSHKISSPRKKILSVCVSAFQILHPFFKCWSDMKLNPMAFPCPKFEFGGFFETLFDVFHSIQHHQQKITSLDSFHTNELCWIFWYREPNAAWMKMNSGHDWNAVVAKSRSHFGSIVQGIASQKPSINTQSTSQLLYEYWRPFPYNFNCIISNLTSL